jgi:transposase
MIRPTSQVGVRIWLATSPVDMRRSFDVLAEYVRTILSQDPLSGHLFVFRNRNSERVKILRWDQNGYAIFYKRIERSVFQFPSSSSSSDKTVSIDSAGLVKLLAGMNPQ